MQRHSHLSSTSEYAYITTETYITMIPIEVIGPLEEDLSFTFATSHSYANRAIPSGVEARKKSTIVSFSCRILCFFQDIVILPLSP